MFKEFTYDSVNGTDKVCAWAYYPYEKPKAVIQFMHGICDHSRRYMYSIYQLMEAGYAVFAADCPQTGYGINCTELANFIAKTYPDCKVAYNLDGGGSSRLFMGQKRVNKANGRREIYGMIYFASAVSEE